ncbi:MAG: glycosyltransferase [Gemmatimonadota bacterium]|nr:glycosyltransferase [Gemmatimonadota bacterium]
MRIVYLSGSGQLGGAERCLLDVMQSVHQHEPSWELTLIASRDGPLLDATRGLGIDAAVEPIPGRLAGLGDSTAGGHAGRLAGLAVRAAGALPGAWAYRSRLRRALAMRAPDIVHTNGYKMHIMGTWSRPQSSALVWHLHDYVSTRPLMARAIRVLSRRCDAGIAVSESVATDAAGAWRGRLPIRVVRNAVDLETFRPDGPRADLDALAGMAPPPAGTLRVGLVATLGRFKGHDVFLQAVARLPRSLPIRAYVVSGSLYETRDSEFSLAALRRMAADLGIADRVGFTGFVAAPADAMRALDVVVHATTMREPFGLVIAEGMACGRAVITSAAGGAAEVIRAGEDALTHRPGDAEDLAQAIARLAADGALRARLGASGRRAATVRFDRRRLGGEVGSLYQAAIAAHRTERRTA